MKQNFIKQGYRPSRINECHEKIALLDRTGKKNFKNEANTAYKRIKNLQEIIGTQWIEKASLKIFKPLKEGKCTTCWLKA